MGNYQIGECLVTLLIDLYKITKMAGNHAPLLEVKGKRKAVTPSRGNEVT